MKLKDIDALIASALSPKLHDNAVTLLGTEFLLLPSVHFIAAVTKQGKTNLAANMVCNVLTQFPEGKVFVGLNEETPEDFIIRCACIITNYSFSYWKANKLTEVQRADIATVLRNIAPRIRFADEESTNLGCLEDVVHSVKAAAHSDLLKLVVFDYLQNVYLSRKHPGKSQYELSKMLGTQLKDIGKTCSVPVVVFGQLKGEMDDVGFKSRVEGDSWFVNNVASGVELKAFKKEKISSLTVQIDRFQNMTHREFWFEHSHSGRLIPTSRQMNSDNNLVDDDAGMEL